MDKQSLDIVILGLSLSSSWGNGHATTYRSLIKGLAQEGHRVLFLERNAPWYATNRDLTSIPYCRLQFYENPAELYHQFHNQIKHADLVIMGSYLRDGTDIIKWVTKHACGITAFYDIDTPVTLSKLELGDNEYISKELIPKFHLYLSFSGGDVLEILEDVYQAEMARPLYCSVDPEIYYPESYPSCWELGYLGTYSTDRQPAVEKLILDVARQQTENKFVVAGPQYPGDIRWPGNVERIDHLPPDSHREFYNRQKFTLNVTRNAMITAGFSPSVRLFEAAACATPVISDSWYGMDSFFEPDKEILIAETTEDVQRYLKEITGEEIKSIGRMARQKVLNEHSSRKRARQLTGYLRELENIAV